MTYNVFGRTLNLTQLNQLVGRHCWPPKWHWYCQLACVLQPWSQTAHCLLSTTYSMQYWTELKNQFALCNRIGLNGNFSRTQTALGETTWAGFFTGLIEENYAKMFISSVSVLCTVDIVITTEVLCAVTAPFQFYGVDKRSVFVVN